MEELPEECWELILNRLAMDDYRDLKSPSLVCKQFLSITDRLRQKLVAKNWGLYNNSCEGLFRAIERFPNLKEIELFPEDRSVDINRIILRMASSSLDLRALVLRCLLDCPRAENLRKLGSTMKNLKILKCCDLHHSPLGDHHLVAIGDAFPHLEELNIRNSFRPQLPDPFGTNEGIEVISRKLLGLRKIDISWTFACSDQSLIALSSNCAHLEEIRCTGGTQITKRGIYFLLSHSPNLISLQADYRESSRGSSFNFADSMICATALRVLDLCGHEDLDQLLCSIAKASISLEKLILRKPPKSYSDDYGLILHGFSTLLCACPNLKHLELWYISFLNDHSMRDLCRYLPNAVSVKLFWCSNLTMATFFILAKECPALSEIVLNFSSPRSFRVEDDFVMGTERNYRIGSLDLSSNQYLNDKLLKKIVVTCPNLHTINVRGCDKLTTKGIGEILRCCSQVKHLGVPRLMEVLSETFKTRQINVEYC